ncbi:hypothetical protein [Halogeometricum limi]|uniref:Lipoprotein n=1 Tax=Halogeometricum limi TaxID=555875 RepID=A0A1I6GTS3_9EURY|nr:hypothetical protein [Halogeometricum limi]SFR45663.1 hypothetical protein SAMN04488124_1529 [Halogeometricum limi]
MISRRAMVASSLSILTGCASSVLPPRDTDDYCEYEAIARPIDPVEAVPPAYAPAQRRLAVRAIRGGTATAFYGPRPLKNDSYVVFDGAYYEVSLAKSTAKTLPALLLRVEWRPEQEASEDTPNYSFGELPPVDRQALRSVVYGGVYRTWTHPENALLHSASPVLYPHGTASSLLATLDSCWIRWNDRAYEVTVHGESSTEQSVYEYEARQVASDAEGFRALMAERCLVRLNSLSSEQETIVRRAIADKYRRRSPTRLPEFDSLWDTLGKEGALLPEADRWYIEYEGERYGLELSMYCQGAPAESVSRPRHNLFERS